MSESVVDFAVFGSTPLSRLLAGLLAAQHGRTVIHVGHSQSAYRLARGIDLSVAPITRPESWAMLRAGVAETLKLLGKLAGRNAVSHLDLLFLAQSPQAAEALGHIRQMASGFGIAAEPAPPSLAGAGRQGLRMRDAVRLNRAVLEPALDAWLDKVGVQRLVPDRVVIGPQGSVSLGDVAAPVAARQAVLADDEAILRYLPVPQWSPLLVRKTSASLLSTPLRALAAPVVMDLDFGLVAQQQAEAGIAVTGMGDMANVVARFEALIGRDSPIELAGQTAFPTLVTFDGAAAVGRASGEGADVVAGLGASAAFFAPALARWLCGDADPFEAAWFGARLVNRSGGPFPVTDYRPGLIGDAA